ncbi:MAG TPA: hypothetical protein VFA29_05780 [Candidatus Baltobacteraceae bacterium]|nr:hypothetical protein [Candidatus Baltobacteraceae bacterium]
MVHRLDEILAQTDPFDLAQALERYAGMLPASRIRELAAGASRRGGEYYRSELSALLRPELDDRELRQNFVRFLKSNLRAIALFGPAFGEDVLRICPQHRVVAIGQESGTDPKTRSMVIAGTAIALLVLGAAAEHAVSTAKAAAQLPDSARTPVPVAAVPLVRRTPQRAAPRLSSARPSRSIAIAQPAPEYSAPQTQPAAPETPQFGGPARPLARAVQRTHQRSRDVRGPVVSVPVPAATPNSQASPIDVNDVPDAYNDATPLPQPSAANVEAPAAVHVPVPSPSPKRRSWLHRALMHLDPFKPSGN